VGTSDGKRVDVLSLWTLVQAGQALSVTINDHHISLRILFLPLGTFLKAARRNIVFGSFQK